MSKAERTAVMEKLQEVREKVLPKDKTSPKLNVSGELKPYDPQKAQHMVKQAEAEFVATALKNSKQNG